jgi:hypothetical protein
MYFELIKEVIKFTLNTGYSKKNLQTLGIIKDREDITKDKLLSYMDYLFSFTTNFYKKQALHNILNNFEVYYQIERVLKPTEHWKEKRHVVTVRDNLTAKYINKYRTYDEAAAKVLWLKSKDFRPELYKYRILGYMSYVASDVEYLNPSTELCLLQESHVPDYIDKDYIEYEALSIPLPID